VNAREKSRDGQPSDPRHFARDTCYRTDDLSAARHLKILTHASGLLASSASQGLTATPLSLSIDPIFTAGMVVSRASWDLLFLLTPRLQRSSQSFRPQLTPDGARRARLSALLLRRPNAILHRIDGARR
jgi:hypothetical protein